MNSTSIDCTRRTMESSNETNPVVAAYPPITRKIIRLEVERILSRTVLPIRTTTNSRQVARRIAARKSLAIRIENSLYRRAPNMQWYADRSALGWRVVKIAQEMLAASVRRDVERDRRRAIEIVFRGERLGNI